MTDPINLQQLREEAERGDAYIFGWDPDQSDVLLALIDTAEAAHAFNEAWTSNATDLDIISAQGPLAEALTKFTWTQP